MCKVWIGFYTRRAAPGAPGASGASGASRESPHRLYLLQLVQELILARIVTAAGLDQAVTQVISDHLVGVQVSEDPGKQMRDVLRAQRGGAQTQHLRLRDRRELLEPGAEEPRGEAVLAAIGEGER